MSKVTKKELRAFLKTKLESDARWTLRALEFVYDHQTDAEKSVEATTEFNGVGFSGADGEFLSSLARQYKERGRLSEKQMQFVFKRVPKYTNQIFKLKENEIRDYYTTRVVA